MVSDPSVLGAVASTGPSSLPELRASMVMLLNLVNVALLNFVSEVLPWVGQSICRNRLDCCVVVRRGPVAHKTHAVQAVTPRGHRDCHHYLSGCGLKELGLSRNGH